MAHGFGCVRALRLPAYAERFASAGYVVVVFDYRYFGDSGGSPRQLLDVAAQLDDWRAAIAWARTLDGVEPGRVVGWGTSLSGGHVITLAGTGAPLAAIIAQVPHLSGLAAVRATGVRQSARLLPAALEDTVRALFHRPPRYVDSVGRPGSRAIMVTPTHGPGGKDGRGRRVGPHRHPTHRRRPRRPSDRDVLTVAPRRCGDVRR